jgi:hypothetical protein
LPPGCEKCSATHPGEAQPAAPLTPFGAHDDLIERQPAAPARTEAEHKSVDSFGGCGVATCALCYQARAESEQAVLDAMSQIEIVEGEDSGVMRLDPGYYAQHALCRAELARREAAK